MTESIVSRIFYINLQSGDPDGLSNGEIKARVAFMGGTEVRKLHGMLGQIRSGEARWRWGGSHHAQGRGLPFVLLLLPCWMLKSYKQIFSII